MSKFRDVNYRIDRKPTAQNCPLKDFSISQKANFRGGVIPYINYEGRVFFCLGVDKISKDVTDLGGGIRKTDVTILAGAEREMNEESLGVFPPLSQADPESLCVYSDNMVTILAKFTLEPPSILEEFKKRYKTTVNPEVCDLKWVTQDEFLRLIMNQSKHNVMYTRVAKLLKTSLKEISKLV